MPASLPDNPVYCFCPHSHDDGEPPQIRILVEGLAFAIPTALVALSAADGLVLCDRLNRALGLDRNAWTALAGRCLRASAGRVAWRHAALKSPGIAAAPPVRRGRSATGHPFRLGSPRSRKFAAGREAERCMRRASARWKRGRRAPSLPGAPWGDTTMFAFDTDYDVITPAGGELLAELGLDTASVRDALADDRARRCPDREAPADKS